MKLLRLAFINFLIIQVMMPITGIQTKNNKVPQAYTFCQPLSIIKSFMGNKPRQATPRANKAVTIETNTQPNIK